jgi:BirA family biotin operon repressor/biotin-[acetyl-CoA-carboxylase] ligase
MPGSLRAEDVVPRLRGRFGRDYRYVERTSSTQRLLGADDPEGAVAVADEQTEGRGRLGRTWLAPAGTSLLCSLLLRPEVEPARLPELSVVAGRACAEAIAETTGLAPDLKFPNDILLEAGREVDRGELLVALLAALERRYDEWLRSAGTVDRQRHARGG